MKNDRRGEAALMAEPPVRRIHASPLSRPRTRRYRPPSRGDGRPRRMESPETEVFVERTEAAVPPPRRLPPLARLLALLLLVRRRARAAYFLTRDDDDSARDDAPRRRPRRRRRAPQVPSPTSSAPPPPRRPPRCGGGFRGRPRPRSVRQPERPGRGADPGAGSDAPRDRPCGSTSPRSDRRLRPQPRIDGHRKTTTGSTTTSRDDDRHDDCGAPQPATVRDVVGQELADAARAFGDQGLTRHPSTCPRRRRRDVWSRRLGRPERQDGAATPCS